MTGNITKRGESSWRLKYDIPGVAAGDRKTVYATIRGSKRDAERELRKRLGAIDDGTHVDPSAETVARYFAAWLDQDHDLSPKTKERYRQLVAQQIAPHLGVIALQKLRPAEVAAWHSTLLAGGGHAGKPLSARTVGHAHRVLHRGLARAVGLEALSRNVASAVKPPKVRETEIEILTADQISEVLTALDGYGGRYGWLPLHAIATVALGTGARRGELLALTWGAVDFDQRAIRIERSLEETAVGVRVKTPKTPSGRRTVTIGATVADALRRGNRHRDRGTRGHRWSAALSRAPSDARLAGRDVLPRIASAAHGGTLCGTNACRGSASTASATAAPRP